MRMQVHFLVLSSVRKMHHIPLVTAQLLVLLLGIAVEMAAGDQLTCRDAASADGGSPAEPVGWRCVPVRSTSCNKVPCSMNTSVEDVDEIIGCNAFCRQYNSSNLTLKYKLAPFRDVGYYSINVSWDHLNLPPLGEWRYELKMYSDVNMLTSSGAERCVCSESTTSSNVWKTSDVITAYYNIYPPAQSSRTILLLIFNLSDNVTPRYAASVTFEKPSSCRDILPLNLEYCTPPRYDRVRNLTHHTFPLEKTNKTEASLSWIAPQQDDRYNLQLVYYISIVKTGSMAEPYYFEVTNSTNIIIGPLEAGVNYSCVIETIVECGETCGVATHVTFSHVPPTISPSLSPTASSPTHLPVLITSSPTHLPVLKTSSPSLSPTASSPTHLPVLKTSSPTPPSTIGNPKTESLSIQTTASFVAAVCVVSAALLVIVLALSLSFLYVNRRRKRERKIGIMVPTESSSVSTTVDIRESKTVEVERYIQEEPRSFQISTSECADSSTSSEQVDDQVETATHNVVVIYSSGTSEGDKKVIQEHLVNILSSYPAIKSTFYQHDESSIRKGPATWLHSKLSQNCNLLVVCNESFLNDWNREEFSCSDESSLIFTLNKAVMGQLNYQTNLSNVGVVLLCETDSKFVPLCLQHCRRLFVTETADIAFFIVKECKYQTQ